MTEEPYLKPSLILLGVASFFLVGITLAIWIRDWLSISGMSALVLATSCELTVLIVTASWIDTRREKKK